MYRMRGSKNTIFTLVIKAGSYLISETIARRRFSNGKAKKRNILLAHLFEAQKSEH